MGCDLTVEGSEGCETTGGYGEALFDVAPNCDIDGSPKEVGILKVHYEAKADKNGYAGTVYRLVSNCKEIKIALLGRTRSPSQESG